MGVSAGPHYLDGVLVFTITAHDPATGAMSDADGTPTWRVYAEENGTAVETGTMAKLDDTNTTGFYSGQLTLSNANGYFENMDYAIYIEVEVGGVTAANSLNFRIIPAPVTAGAMADAVWDSSIFDHGTADTFGQIVNSTNSSIGAMDASITTIRSFLTIHEDVIGDTGNDTTHLHLPWLSHEDVSEQEIVFVDLTTGNKYPRWITDWDDGTKLATITPALPVTPQNDTDTYTILTERRDVSGGGGGGASAADIWSYTTRTLTALDEDTTTLDIDAAVRAAVGLASANLDTQIAGINTNVDAGEAKLDGLIADIGANGVGLTALPWNAAWDAEVQSEVADALAVYDPPTHAELTSAVAPLATAANLATVAGYIDTEIASILQDTGTDIPAQITALAATVAGLATQASLNGVIDQTDEVWRVLGLDSAAPLTVTPASMAATGISIAISGDGTATTTLTRA